jgi:hypothetical protein
MSAGVDRAGTLWTHSISSWPMSEMAWALTSPSCALKLRQDASGR